MFPYSIYPFTKKYLHIRFLCGTLNFNQHTDSISSTELLATLSFVLET